jgi:hypothetical protein
MPEILLLWDISRALPSAWKVHPLEFAKACFVPPSLGFAQIHLFSKAFPDAL